MKDLFDMKMLEKEIELATIENRIRKMTDDGKAKIEEDYFRAVKGFKLLGIENYAYREPPKFKRLYPKFPLFPATTADWDFENVNWQLNTVIYVSAPSSLHGLVTAWTLLLCNYAGTTAINAGRLVSQLRSSNVVGTGLPSQIFRNQSPVGVTNNNNTYKVYLFDTTWQLSVYVIGSESAIDVKAYTDGFAPINNTWYKTRLTWWESSGVLVVRMERWTGSAWSAVSGDMTDVNNRWSGNPDNRVGYQIYNTSYVDDTEIWG